MQQFWDRYVELKIEDLIVASEDLDIYFRVKNSTGEGAGRADIMIFNLAEASRQLFTPGTQIILKGGYRNDYGIIFAGSIKEVEDEAIGADLATKLYCQDDTMGTLKTEINLRYPAGTAYEDIAKSLFSQAGIPVGVIENTGLSLGSAWTTGPITVAEALKRIQADIEEVSGAKYNYYVKDGAGYFVSESTRYEEAVVLSSETGLIEVQKIDQEDAEADYRVKALMLWKITQDSLLDIDSVKVKGLFRVVSYEKIAGEEEYYTEMEVKAA